MRTLFKVLYSGAGGRGTGALAFVDGKIVGFDFAGAVFRGSYVFRDRALVGHLSQAAENGSVAIELPFEIDSESVDQTISLATPAGLLSIQMIKMDGL